MDGKAARVAETEAGAEGIKIASRAHVCPSSRIGYDVTSQRYSKRFRWRRAIIVFESGRRKNREKG